MSKNLLQIDVSNFKNVGEEEDLIKINIDDDDFVQVNFSKLVSYSKYIRDKYKYSEAKISLENDIKKFAKENEVKDESIKYFIELIEEEKVTIQNEHYRDIYRLSEYFNIPIFISALDKLREETLYRDVNFTLQFLNETIKSIGEEEETKLNSKIEIFLATQINECIMNEKFSTLPTSTIYRILEKCSDEMIDHNLLIEFILKSVETRFIFLKFVKFHKLSDSEVDRFSKIMREQNTKNKERYFEYIPFDLIFHETQKIKYDLLFDEINETKDELKRTKDELNKMKENFSQTKIKLDQTKDELEQKKEELNQIQIKCNQTNEELKRTKGELNQIFERFQQIKEDQTQTKDKFGQTKEELEQTKIKFNEAINEIKQIKREMFKYAQSVIVAGANRYNKLGDKPNNINENDKPVISPPAILSFDHSSLLSYSVCSCHSVLIMNNGSLQGIGKNSNGTISGSLIKTDINQFTEFSIKDDSGHQLTPISAVCGLNGTLYMLLKSSGIGKHLVYCNYEINGGDPCFLDIGNHDPVALFGGRSHAAAISSEGKIIFINHKSVIKLPSSLIPAFSLPDCEKATSISCNDDSIIVLSSNGRIFSSLIESESSILKFSIVEELVGEEIICISGSYEHFLAVSKKGRVFGRGSNKNGRLGFSKETKSVSSFTEISSLSRYEVRAAYAGRSHSLFETRKGQILACGTNAHGQLLLSSGLSEDVYSPTETTIKGGSTFCIAGDNFSVVFIGIGPPPNTPNRGIHKQLNIINKTSNFDYIQMHLIFHLEKNIYSIKMKQSTKKPFSIFGEMGSISIGQKTNKSIFN